ncbi:MAG: S41 family peptidase [bacterium]
MNVRRYWQRLYLAIILMMVGLGVQPTLAEDQKEEDKPRIPVEELRIFAEVFGRVKRDYVESVSDRELLDYAIRGMLSGLDPHSAYLDEEDFADMKVGTSGQFGGLGLEVGIEDGFVRVISPIDDTPAQRAGVEAGDLIIRLDGKSVKGLSLDEAVKKMRGKPGTTITLTVTREGHEGPLEFEIERAVVKVASVRQQTLEPGYGYVRLSQFQSHTAADMVTAIGKLKKASGGKLDGLVLDLRNNPGGVLNAAVAVSDAFLTSGLIVYTEGRAQDSRLSFEASADDILDGAALVVLVNGGSASASEIVAGALQDQRRAVVMGKPTFGKGSVQTIIPVTETIAIKFTTARYYTPNGRSIQAEGIVPDIELKPLKLAKAKKKSRAIKEADLANHLANPDGEEGDNDSPDNGNGSKLAESDFAVHEALNLLKGMAILRPAAIGNG